MISSDINCQQQLLCNDISQDEIKINLISQNEINKPLDKLIDSKDEINKPLDNKFVDSQDEINKSLNNKFVDFQNEINKPLDKLVDSQDEINKPLDNKFVNPQNVISQDEQDKINNISQDEQNKENNISQDEQGKINVISQDEQDKINNISQDKQDKINNISQDKQINVISQDKFVNVISQDKFVNPQNVISQDEQINVISQDEIQLKEQFKQDKSSLSSSSSSNNFEKSFLTNCESLFVSHAIPLYHYSPSNLYYYAVHNIYSNISRFVLSRNTSYANKISDNYDNCWNAINKDYSDLCKNIVGDTKYKKGIESGFNELKKKYFKKTKFHYKENQIKINYLAWSCVKEVKKRIIFLIDNKNNSLNNEDNNINNENINENQIYLPISDEKLFQDFINKWSSIITYYFKYLFRLRITKVSSYGNRNPTSTLLYENKYLKDRIAEKYYNKVNYTKFIEQSLIHNEKSILNYLISEYKFKFEKIEEINDSQKVIELPLLKDIKINKKKIKKRKKEKDEKGKDDDDDDKQIKRKLVDNKENNKEMIKKRKLVDNKQVIKKRKNDDKDNSKEMIKKVAEKLDKLLDENHETLLNRDNNKINKINAQENKNEVQDNKSNKINVQENNNKSNKINAQENNKKIKINAQDNDNKINKINAQDNNNKINKINVQDNDKNINKINVQDKNIEKFVKNSLIEGGSFEKDVNVDEKNNSDLCSSCKCLLFDLLINKKKNIELDKTIYNLILLRKFSSSLPYVNKMNNNFQEKFNNKEISCDHSSNKINNHLHDNINSINTFSNNDKANTLKINNSQVSSNKAFNKNDSFISDELEIFLKEGNNSNDFFDFIEY